MKRKLSLIFLPVLIATTLFVMGAAEGRRVETQLYGPTTGILQTATVTTPAYVLEKTVFHSVAARFSTTGTNVDATVQVEVGVIVRGARVFFTPTDPSSAFSLAGVGTAETIQALALPVAQYFRITVTNNSADPLDVDDLIFIKQ